jgi:hypothetical protein
MYRKKNYKINKKSAGHGTKNLFKLAERRGGEGGVQPNHTTGKKAWSSMNHSILSAARSASKMSE